MPRRRVTSNLEKVFSNKEDEKIAEQVQDAADDVVLVIPNPTQEESEKEDELLAGSKPLGRLVGSATGEYGALRYASWFLFSRLSTLNHRAGTISVRNGGRHTELGARQAPGGMLYFNSGTSTITFAYRSYVRRLLLSLAWTILFQSHTRTVLGQKFVDTPRHPPNIV